MSNKANKNIPLTQHLILYYRLPIQDSKTLQFILHPSTVQLKCFSSEYLEKYYNYIAVFLLFSALTK